MRHRIVLVATTATVLLTAACATERVLGPPMRYTTTSSIEMMNPTTHRLEAVALPPRRIAPGVTASVTSSATSQPIMIALNAPGTATHAESRQFGFTASDGHPAKIVFLYGASGGPPAAIQSYRDKALMSTDAYQWTRTASGWMQTSSVLTFVSLGAVVGRVTTTTVPCHTNCGPPQTVMHPHHLAGSLLYAVMNATSSCASAQWYNMHFGACALAWAHYSAMLAAEVAAVALPEAGPVAWAAAAGAMAEVELAEIALVDCMASQPEAGESAMTNGNGGSGAATLLECLSGAIGSDCTAPYTQ